MKKKGFTVRQIAFDAMLAAMFFALSFVSLRLGGQKISISGLPVLMGALLFGPLHGFLIGLVGSFLEQMVTFGLTATTILWCLPVAIRGLLVGLYAKWRKFDLGQWELIVVIALTALVLTALNTAVMYIDAVIYGYYSYAYVFGALVSRIIVGILTGVVFALVLPPLLKPIKKVIEKLDKAAGYW